MPLPKSLTTVTPFSKALAMVIFILFPILAFFLGMAYQESVNNIKIRNLEEKLIQLSRYPTPTPDYTDITSWKIYKNNEFGYEVKYPNDWVYHKLDDVPELLNVLCFGNSEAGCIISITIDSGTKWEEAKKFLDLSIGGYTEEITFTGQKALRRVGGLTQKQGGPTKDIIIILANNRKVYQIWGHQQWQRSKDYTQQSKDYTQQVDQILSTFKFLPASPQGGDQTPSPTCIPRPACLDATPRCLMPESENMCPPKPTGQTACTQEAKLCPDGSYVGRTGPNCEFAACP